MIFTPRILIKRLKVIHMSQSWTLKLTRISNTRIVGTTVRYYIASPLRVLLPQTKTGNVCSAEVAGFGLTPMEQENVKPTVPTPTPPKVTIVTHVIHTILWRVNVMVGQCIRQRHQSDEIWDWHRKWNQTCGPPDPDVQVLQASVKRRSRGRHIHQLP